jgi:FkbM family methyltransferase
MPGSWLWPLFVVFTMGALAILTVLAIDGRRTADRLRVRLSRITWRAQRAEADLLRLRKRVLTAEARAALAARGRPARFAPEFRSQYGEDAFLWELFEGRLDGYFIEVGAYDGLTLSVSAVFEAVGWKGLLVEPMPGPFERCRRQRPASRVVQAALSRRGSVGMTDFAVATGGDHADMRSGIAIPGQATAPDAASLTRVPVSTMDEVLAGAPPEGIDFVVLDVEGHEADLLDGFDLRRFRPRVLVIEDVEMGGGPLPAILGAAAYAQAGWIGINRVFVREDEPALLARASELASRAEWSNRVPA